MEAPASDGNNTGLTRREILAAAAASLAVGAPRAAFAAAPAGQLSYGVHVSLAPSWFDQIGRAHV